MVSDLIVSPRRTGFPMRVASRVCSRATVAKNAAPQTFDRDFVFDGDRDLDDKIASFRDEHERNTGERLAMHARRSLGATKVRITFRIVEAAKKR